MAPRYALYIAPPADHPLHKFAAEWLGHDPETGERHAPAAAAGLGAARIAALTEEPRRYGFHGTLKPPFRLAEGCNEARLIGALETFASDRRPLHLPPLKLTLLGRFLALCPSAPCPEMDALAADCLRAFDRFRAPASAAELAKRRAAGLTPRQEAHLSAWGYPYVLEDFRLHFTLTGRIDDAAERIALQQHLGEATRAFAEQEYIVDGICLFVQATADSGFRIAGRYRFGG